MGATMREWGRWPAITGHSISRFVSIRVGLHQGGPLSPGLFIIFMDRVCRCHQVVDDVGFVGLRISSLLFVDDTDQGQTDGSGSVGSDADAKLVSCGEES